MKTRHDQVKSIFLSALEIDGAEQRHAFIAGRCAGDDTLRAEVEKLLAHQQGLGGFLQGAPAGLTADFAARGGPSPLPFSPWGRGEEVRGAVEGPGTIIGPYKLLEQIGEGGFGVVFMAEQQQPVRRKVALKVIKAGMDSRQVIARFEAERQALALMDHPNIAKVFDGGTTGEVEGGGWRVKGEESNDPSTRHPAPSTPCGRPYFVMELVKGTPITAYCDDNQVPICARLELFIHVCQAVQHAHQKGIIHRDIKPSNVLVALHDDAPVVKVIDFGIAKATGARLTDKTLFTGFAQMVGTPLYMSPEQAGHGNLDVDTRSDIYSLGVLLYELLTGTTPFDNERLKAADYDELRRIIREEEPPTPSRRLSTLGQAASTVSTRRQSDPRGLSRLLAGDLDWVVMKALEKDRNRRYETAGALAADVQRYLHDEPVLARPPSAWYRFRKFTRRNKKILAMTGLMLFFIVTLGAAVGWIVRDQAARETALDGEANRAVTEARSLIDAGNWPEALAVIQRAEKLLVTAGRVREQLPAGLQELDTDLMMARRLEEIQSQPGRPEPSREKQPDTTGASPTVDYTGSPPVEDINEDIFNGPEMAAEYARAFQDYGIDVAVLPIAEAAERIRGRSIQRELARALDFWASTCRRRPLANQPDWKLLLAVAKLADPNPWRNQLREALERGDRKGLEALAASADIRRLPPGTLHLVGAALHDLGATEQAVDFLRQAQRRHPGDLWLNEALGGYCANSLRPPRYEDSVRFYAAALAVRPLNPYLSYSLGRTFSAMGSYREAVAAYTRVIELKPDFAGAWRSRAHDGYAVMAQWDKAAADMVKAVELDPDRNYAMWWHERACFHLLAGDTAAYRSVCQQMLERFGQTKDSTIAHRVALCCSLIPQAVHDEKLVLHLAEQSVAGGPEGLWSVITLAAALYRAGQWEPAAYSGRFVKQYPDPGDEVYGDRLMSWLIVAMAHQRLGQTEEARRWLDKATQGMDKEMAAAKIGPARQESHVWAQCLVLRREAEELMSKGGPDQLTRSSVVPLYNPYMAYAVGTAFKHKGLYREAAAEFTKATALKPKDAEGWAFRGRAYFELQEWDNALADFTNASKLEPKQTVYWSNRALCYEKLNQSDQALANHDKAIEVDPTHGWPWAQRGSYYGRRGEWKLALADYDKAIKLNPKYIEPLLKRGELYMDLKQWDKALAEYSKAVDVAPKYFSAWEHRATFYIALKQWDQALADYTKVSELSPRSSRAWYHRGFIHDNQGQWDEAIADYSRAIELQPDHTPFFVVRGAAYSNLGHWDKARADFDKALADYNRAIALNPQHAFALSHRGHVYAHLKQWAKALADYSKAIELDPNNANTHNSLAWLLATAADPQARVPVLAVHLAKKAVALEPKEASHWGTLGAAHYRAGAWKAALAALEKSMELRKGGDSFDWFFLAMSHEKLGDKEKARQWYDKAVAWMDKNQPKDKELRGFRAEASELLSKAGIDQPTRTAAVPLDDPIMALAVGRAWSLNGFYEEAVAEFTKTIELKPALVEAWRLRAEAYLKLKQLDQALADYSKALKLEPKNASLWMERGKAYGDSRLWDQALADYSEALKLEPKIASGWPPDVPGTYLAIAKCSKAIKLEPKKASLRLERGLLYDRLRQWDQALADYSEAVALDPKNVRSRWCRGTTYAHLGQWDQALADFTETIKLAPKSALMHRGLVYGKLGQNEKALADFSKAIEANPWLAENNRDHAADYAKSIDLEIQNTSVLVLWRQALAKYAEATKPVQAVSIRMRELNPSFDGRIEEIVDNGAVVGLKFSTDNVIDISPIRGLKSLRQLECYGRMRNGKLRNLEPLRGMKLEKLVLHDNQIQDLGPVAGMPLKDLQIHFTPIKDLAPLKGMALEFLDMGGTKVDSLEPLRGMPLQVLRAWSAPVVDISPLRGMPLKSLNLYGTRVKDFSSLKNVPLEELYCALNPGVDLSVLREIRTLRTINGQPAAKYAEAIKVVQALSIRMRELNPSFDGRIEPIVANGAVVGLRFSTDNVIDISPISGLKSLRQLECYGQYQKHNGKLRNLESLQGMKLEKLVLHDNQIQDLSPLAGMPLKHLQIHFTPIKDLAPLKGMPLEYLDIGGTKVASLEPLRGMPLQVLKAWGAPVADISPLREMPLEELDCDVTQGLDLSVLKAIRTLRTIHGLPAALVDVHQGRVYAWSAQWSQAAACYARAAASPAASGGHVGFEQACLCLLTGDEAAYQRTCALLLEAYNGQTKPRGYLVARACTLGPKAVNDLTLAEKAGAPELTGPRDGWAVTASAGLHYRAGRYQKATALLHQSLNDNPNWKKEVLDWLWLALTYHQLGKETDARQWLSKATEWLDGYPQRPPGQSSSLHLHDWLEANVLRREAETLILGKKDSVKK